MLLTIGLTKARVELRMHRVLYWPGLQLHGAACMIKMDACNCLSNQKMRQYFLSGRCS
jgi:hypothetical protein